MCGINGFNFNDKPLLRKMNNVLTHRGPDDSGVYTDKNVSLGQMRLSIIDLTKGLYPVHNEGGTIQLIYNGEIYNYEEVREELKKAGHKFYSDCDAEMLVHAYEEWGVGCLEKFNGMFAFCLYDSEKKKLFLARDRVGIKPLYYYFKDGKFVFSSEIKGILEHNVKREVNPDALNKFINMRYISGEETIFKGIKRLMAGHYLVFDLEKKKLAVKRYWHLKVEDNNILKGDEKFFEVRIKELLKDSVKKRLISDVPLGAYLSGGIDSSAVVGMMSWIKKEEEDDAPILTFSVAFEHGENVNELSEAKEVSEEFGTKHTEFTIKSDIVDLLPKLVWHFDEPLADPAAMPVHELSRKAKKHITVALTGDGGDELFAGYDQYKFLETWEKTKKLPNVVRATAPTVLKGLPKPLIDKIYKYSSDMGEKAIERVAKLMSVNDGARAYKSLISIFDEDERKEIFTKELMGELKEFTAYDALNEKYFSSDMGIVNQASHFDVENLLPECYLMKTDRMTMARSVEGRVPILDHRMAELAFRIPPQLRLKKGDTKYIFKRAMKDIVPDNILKRKKQTFHVPIDKWIEHDLKDKFDDLLSRDEVRRQGYFTYETIEKIKRNYSKSKLVYARQLWSLVNFQIWHKIFIEGEKMENLV